MARYFVTERLSEKISETPEGFLLCQEVPMTRTGIFEYGEGETPIETVNGLTRIFRDDEEVFSDKAMTSFEGKPVTINHPEEFVNPDNWKELSVGVVQNVRRGSGENVDKLISDLLITDANAISLVKSGLREVSCGYEAEYVKTADGEGKQIKIRGNHLALVQRGRAGAGCKIKDNHRESTIMSMKQKLKDMFSKAVDEMPEVAEAEAESVDYAKMIEDMSGKYKDSEAAITTRLDALEAAVGKLLEGAATDEAPKEEEKAADMEEEVEGEIVGDDAAYLEILAPTLAKTGDVKSQALKAVYATDEGKKVIDSLTSGKPTFDSKEVVNTLFVATAQLIKAQRGNGLKETKQLTADSFKTFSNGDMTPEKINEINAERWGKK
jgi:hypothetical protein